MKGAYKALNRTILELNQRAIFPGIKSVWSLNRTILELKPNYVVVAFPRLFFKSYHFGIETRAEKS